MAGSTADASRGGATIPGRSRDPDHGGSNVTEGSPPERSGTTDWVADPEARVAALVDYFRQHADAFTPEALQNAAAGAGYTEGEIERAMAEVQRREGIRPIRRRAVVIVIVAYVLVWSLFAVVFLTRDFTYGAGPVLQFILTCVLIVALIVSTAWLLAVRPDPTRTVRATAILLALPLVLLLGVAGLCVPFTGMG